tara:strand:+ start:2030 stop:3676 length:1647 start_codon:yes stop_codon:yes gene_type:complete
MIWHFNNTTIRNPGRYLEALRAYDEYGHISGLFKRGNVEAHKELYNLILDAGLIKSDDRDNDWNGRKWRLGFYELGLISYKTSNKEEQGKITKTGRALLDAANDAELQDVYLRIIYNLEMRKKKMSFRPVTLILKVIKLLREAGFRESINQKEFSVSIQDYRAELTPNDYFNEIVEFRNNVELNKGNLKNFYQKSFEDVHKRNGNKPSIDTFSKDYPDVTFRFLKLSGLFRTEGSKLILNSQYDKLLDVLSEDEDISESEESYYYKITNLPELPIDVNRDILESIVTENFEALETTPSDIKKLNSEELRYLRINQEDEIRKRNEEIFAFEQRNKISAIASWFECLINKKSIDEFIEGEFISFKTDERPQYLEWIVWRAFLAINNLSNKPYESRKFPLDSELKPTSHAPSRGPDLLMEFDSFILVVEVTWTTSARQVAAEGEPVIRHVAEVSFNSNKSTYCLFIAPEINLNTVEIYRINDKYFLDDNYEQVANIIPISLEEFIEFFIALPKAEISSVNKIHSILQECTTIKKDLKADKWKEYISNSFTI